MSDPGLATGLIRSFHPRRGRITPSAADALERLWPTHGIEIDGRPVDLGVLFGADVPVVLEIGSGMGDAALAMAQSDRSTGVLAVDVHTPGLGRLLREVEARGLTNVRVGRGDAVDLMRDMLAPDSLAGVCVYFPDPWPKAKHHKRRLIRPSTSALIASRLQPGAELRCATDWMPYAERMLVVLSAEPLLANRYPGYAPRAADRPVTKFEGAGLARGHQVRDLVFVRVGQTTGPASPK